MIPDLPNYQGDEFSEIIERLVNRDISFKVYVNSVTCAAHLVISTNDGWIEIAPCSTLNNDGELIHSGLDVEFSNYEKNDYYRVHDADAAMMIINERINQ